MTPQEKLEFEEMKKFIESLRASFSFPFNVQSAIVERINPIIGTGGGLGTANTQGISVPSTPVTITVPATPSGTIPLIYQGAIYNVLFQ